MKVYKKLFLKDFYTITHILQHMICKIWLVTKYIVLRPFVGVSSSLDSLIKEHL